MSGTCWHGKRRLQSGRRVDGARLSLCEPPFCVKDEEDARGSCVTPPKSRSLLAVSSRFHVPAGVRVWALGLSRVGAAQYRAGWRGNVLRKTVWRALTRPAGGG